MPPSRGTGTGGPTGASPGGAQPVPAEDRLGAWLRRLLERNKTKKGRKAAIVALAARLARIMQAMLSSGQAFQPEAGAA